MGTRQTRAPYIFVHIIIVYIFVLLRLSYTSLLSIIFPISVQPVYHGRLFKESLPPCALFTTSHLSSALSTLSNFGLVAPGQESCNQNFTGSILCYSTGIPPIVFFVPPEFRRKYSLFPFLSGSLLGVRFSHAMAS